MATSKKLAPKAFSWMRWLAFGSLFLFVVAALLSFQFYNVGVQAGYLNPVGIIFSNSSAQSSVEQCLRFEKNTEKTSKMGARLVASLANFGPTTYKLDGLQPNQFISEAASFKQYVLGSLNMQIHANALTGTKSIANAGSLTYVDSQGESVVACNFTIDRSNLKYSKETLLPHDNLFAYTAVENNSPINYLNLSAKAVINGNQNGYVHLIIKYAGAPVLDPTSPISTDLSGIYSPNITQINVQTYMGVYRSVSKNNPDACHDRTLSTQKQQPDCVKNITYLPQNIAKGKVSNFLPSSLMLFTFGNRLR